MRVHELAKELGVSSKDLIPRIRKLGHDAKNHMSVISDEIIVLLRKLSAAHPESAPAASAAGEEEVSETAEISESEKSAKPLSKGQKGAKPTSPIVEEEAEEENIQEEAAPSPAGDSTVIKIGFPVTVGEFAKKLHQSIPELIKALMSIGVFANVNQLLNEEIGFKVAAKLGVTIEKEEDEIEKKYVHQKKEDASKLKLRPPIVTMMGHVDHGKTSLLDAIRKTNVAAREKGFITQHIGAYGVDIPGKGHVTFLDTPGHEAFTAMRARGANVTDVVVLVVAADDGIMPQTIEAVDHAREAKCPIVVAINKSDLPSANPQRVMTGLQKIGLMPEEWGGKTICTKVSAKTGAGINELLDLLLLEAEVLELKANPDCAASGTVIESHLSKASGPIASMIVQRGTLKVGDTLLCGQFYGRVRALRNDLGKTIKDAGPSRVAEVSGLNGVPEAGETFVVVEDERTARQIAEKRVLAQREKQMRGARHLSLEELYDRISEGNFKELKLILKADVQGSIEALKQSLEKLSNEKCSVRVIHGGIGGINESDIMLAAASDAIVLGFHVKADTKAQQLSEKEGVDIRYYNIIYEVVDDVRKAMEGLLEPTYKEVVEGKVQIRKIFKSSKIGSIGGAYVLKGKCTRQHQIRLLRNHIVVFEGKLASLKRFQDDVREVAEGFECGVALQGYDEIQEGDILECFRMEKIAAKM